MRAQFPLPHGQRMPCPTNTSVRNMFFEDIIDYVINYVPGFRSEVFKLKDWGNEGLQLVASRFVKQDVRE